MALCLNQGSSRGWIGRWLLGVCALFVVAMEPNGAVAASGMQTRQFECQGLFRYEGSLGPQTLVKIKGSWEFAVEPEASVVEARVETQLAELGGDYADDLVFEKTRSSLVHTEDGSRLEFTFFKAPLEEVGAEGFTGFYLRLPTENGVWKKRGTEFDSDLDFYADGQSMDHAPLLCEVL